MMSLLVGIDLKQATRRKRYRRPIEENNLYHFVFLQK